MNKLLTPLLLSLVLLLTGCVQSPGSAEPPVPKITAAGESIPSVTGSYCWGRRCVDTISPPELLAFKKVAPTVLPGGSKVSFALSPTPTETGVTLWSAGEPQTVALAADGTLLLPTEPGIYVYDLFARWTDGKGSQSASYAFHVEIR